MGTFYLLYQVVSSLFDRLNFHLEEVVHDIFPCEGLVYDHGRHFCFHSFMVAIKLVIHYQLHLNYFHFQLAACLANLFYFQRFDVQSIQITSVVVVNQLQPHHQKLRSDSQFSNSDASLPF